jgi:outer membrane protein TolC
VASARFVLHLCWAIAYAARASAQEPLTLDDALREARAANAALPVAHFDTLLARARVREARGALGPRFALDGDVHGGTPLAYTGNDARFQVIADQTLYAGGGLRASLRMTAAQARAAGARYRVAEKDVELEVRTRFSALLRVEDELALRREGIARLKTYLAGIEARSASGQGVADDLSKTRVRMGAQTADLADAERRLDEARLELNDLLGRAPDSTLMLAPLPLPAAPAPDSAGESWSVGPDVRSANANVDAAAAGVAVARAAGRPHLSVNADAGVEPLFPGTPPGSGLNTGHGWGMEVTVSMSVPIWDAGVIHARVMQAQLSADQARQTALVVRRQARLEWLRAGAALASLYRQVDARRRNVPIAQDSYLQAQSLYRGGVATALDVLDAYAAWIDASQAAADAVLSYRVAEAQLARWGTP